MFYYNKSPDKIQHKNLQLQEKVDKGQHRQQHHRQRSKILTGGLPVEADYQEVQYLRRSHQRCYAHTCTLVRVNQHVHGYSTQQGRYYPYQGGRIDHLALGTQHEGKDIESKTHTSLYPFAKASGMQQQITKDITYTENKYKATNKTATINHLSNNPYSCLSLLILKRGSHQNKHKFGDLNVLKTVQISEYLE